MAAMKEIDEGKARCGEEQKGVVEMRCDGASRTWQELGGSWRKEASGGRFAEGGKWMKG
jgi:hypothetical protein